MGRNPTRPRINIFLYTDFRQYLKDLITELKTLHPELTMRSLAKEVGFGSPSFLKMIIDGKRTLTKPIFLKLCSYLSIHGRELEFFEHLVDLQQTSDPDTKRKIYEDITASRPRPTFSQLKKNQGKYLAHDYYACIREMVLLKDFREDAKWIAARCLPRIKPAEAREAIQTLLELKLLSRDAQGRLIQSDPIVDTGSNVEAIEAFSFHEAVLNKARKYLSLLKQEQRDFTALTVPLPLNMKAEILKKIIQLQNEILAMVNAEKVEYDEVYQINFQFFPVTSDVPAVGSRAQKE